MSRFTLILLATSIAALLGAASVARADGSVVYEWTDAKGQVHYTDQWVPGAKLIRIQTAHAAASSGAEQGIQSESDAASRDVKDENDAHAVQQDEAKAKAARCAREQQQYQQLIQSRRIFTTDKSGQRQYLSDAQADALRLKARQNMEADCGG